MTKKYRAAALTAAILAAGLAAPLSPAAAQWSSMWADHRTQDFRLGDWPDKHASLSNGDIIPGCYQKPYPVTAAAPTEAPLPTTWHNRGYSADYSVDGGLTWTQVDGETRRVMRHTSGWIHGWAAEYIDNDKSQHPYIIGEFGSITIYLNTEGYDPYYTIDSSKTVRGECDGPLAGQFRLRDYDVGEYSADGGLTWVSGGPYIGTDGTNWYDNYPVKNGYVEGERSVDNGDGPEAGMHRYRYTRDSSDPQARLVGYYMGCPGLSQRVGTLAVPATCFVDFDGSNVHAENIQALVERSITRGCGGGRFCPNRTVTRAQMAAFLHRAVYGPQEVSEPPALSDVPSDAWYRTPALWAVKNNVIRAPGGRFDPGGAVTRADMAEMLAAVPRFNITVPDRAQGLFDDTTGLPDATVRAIEGIRAAGVTAGCATEPLRYCPDKPVNRAQMASFLIRALRR